MNTPASAAEVSFVRGASDKRELAANQCDIRNRFIALLPSPPSLTIERTRLAGGSIWFSSCKRVSAFLALFRKLLSAFFGVNEKVSSPGESHPEALAELYVSLSTHTAPIKEPCRVLPSANGQTSLAHAAKGA